MTTSLLPSAPALLVGGEHVPGAGDPVAVHDPSTDELLAHVADADAEQALRAVDVAAEAFETWRGTAPRHRSEVLHRCFELMRERAEDLATLIASENGKAIADARGEVAYAAEFFRWYAEEAVRSRGELTTAPSGAHRVIVQQEPIGVALLVTPWNFPAAMVTRKVAPAIAAGCSVVLKPATETPLTALALAALCREAGVPDGVLNVVTTTRSAEVVGAVLQAEPVRALSFTGSTEVGRLLLRQSADRVLRTSMELGGNAPFVVFDDADLDAALEGLMLAKMRNGGQACTAANRVLAQAGIADALAAGLRDRMAALRVGPGTEEATQCGPLISAAAVDGVHALVEGAVEEGATLLVGGEPVEGAGSFYPPTVLADVPHAARILQEEIFGPVAVVATFDDEDEAVRLANTGELGLAAYVYTADLARGLRVSERLQAGMVGLNRGIVSEAAAPFGGVRQSGLGREGAQEGMREFQETKYIAAQW